jgi:hypothetical protein
MEKVTIILNKEFYIELRELDVLTPQNSEVKYIDESFDYTQYPAWIEAKKESDKAFRELKKIEFDIRNK